jgi:pimeloyl-ACP methyl ester carboxylesterase
LRYAVAPLVGAAMLPLNFKLMFGPAPVPDRFKRGFPRGLPVRPSQLRAEAQDSAFMVPAVAAMQDRYRELRMPVVIMAGAKDRVVDVGRHAMRLHKDIPQSSLRLSPGVGHMLHYAVPEKVTDAIEAAVTGRPTTAVHRTAAAPHSSAEWPVSETAP